MLEILTTDFEKVMFVNGCFRSYGLILYIRKYSGYLCPKFQITPLPSKIPAYAPDQVSYSTYRKTTLAGITLSI